MTPALLDDTLQRRKYIYPPGIDNAHYIIVPYEADGNGVARMSGAFTAHGPEAQQQLNQCLNKRLDGQSLRTTLMPRSPGASMGYAVLERR